jgi:hypothetical protein
MPFIVRCPHCRKYMLIEDELRGAMGACLLCKSKLLFDSSQADHPANKPPAAVEQSARPPANPAFPIPPKPPAPPTPTPPPVAPPPVAPAEAAPPAPAAPPTETRVCPHCSVSMRVPTAARGRKIRCPKCQQEFR